MTNDPTIGELDSRVLIRRWQDLPNADFGTTPDYDAGYEIWCKLVPSGSAIYFGTMQVNESVTHQAFVRYTPDINDRTVTGQHVVECEGERYRVKRATKWGGQKVFLYLELELLGSIEVSDGPGN